MSAPSKRPVQKRTRIKRRIKSDERGLIDRAAELTGKTRTDFVLEAARRAAVQALSDRTLYLASPEAFAKFVAALDAQPRPNAKLRRTMQARAPWDKTSGKRLRSYGLSILISDFSIAPMGVALSSSGSIHQAR